MNNRPLNYSINDPDDGTIKTMLHARDYVMTEKVMNNEEFKVNLSLIHIWKCDINENL